MSWPSVARCLLLAAVFTGCCACSVPAGDVSKTLEIGGSRIEVVIESGTLQVTETELLNWVKMAAESVTNYYGKFPVPHVLVRISPSGGEGVRNGMTWGRGGGLIKIKVGQATTASDLSSDWMLTHEMIHLAFPSVADEHHWIEEGISVYVEPIARIRANNMHEDEMWADLVRDMPKGLPQPGDRGLDHTHTWARTYWGGALFCFLADVKIREATHNQKGLQDALRGILYAGGDITQDWDLEKALKVGDQATGTSVLIELYAKMKDKSYDVDLLTLWKQLGVQVDGKSVQLLPDASMADVRRAIMNQRPKEKPASQQ